MGFVQQKRATVSEMLNQNHVRRRFERAADRFDDADFVHAATRDGLLARLQPLLITAKNVVDLGSATSSASRSLRQRFKGARVISVDIAHRMLKKARVKKSWLSRPAFIQASADALPFANESVDLIFANQLLPWISDPAAVFSEIARVLTKGGVFAFATLGPDSLQEIRRAWRQVDDLPHAIAFPDMHDLGDGLVGAGLCDPVLDVDRLSVSYENTEALFADLTAVGARNSLRERAPGLTGRHRYSAMTGALRDAAGDGRISLNLELVYGHCWGAGPKMDPHNYRIDANRIPLRRG